MRLVYSRALSRPDPQDIAKAVGIVNDTQNPPTVSLGNPDLKPEHANNYDMLLEQYLSPLGLIQAGYFYKSLTDPIIATQTRPTTGAFAGFLVSQPGNAGSATLQGFEVAYQQHLTFLPGALAGFGLSANYSYTTSKRAACRCGPTARRCCGRRRIRGTSARPTTAGRVSLRVGMSYNGANLFAYQYQNLNTRRHADRAGDLTAGGTTGPGGDSYLYAHFQLDAQAVAAGRARTLGGGLRTEPERTRCSASTTAARSTSCSASSTSRRSRLGFAGTHGGERRWWHTRRQMPCLRLRDHDASAGLLSPARR